MCANIWDVNFLQEAKPEGQGLTPPFQFLGSCTSQTPGIILMYSEHDLPCPH